MAKKIVAVVETVQEPIIDPIKPVKVKKIKKLCVEVPEIVMQVVEIKDVPIKPKRTLLPEQLLKMKEGKLKAQEARLLANKK